MYQNFWSIRQNPYAKTNQNQMRDFILSQNVVTCPFGHIGNGRNNVIDGVYNERNSMSQDRKFIEEVKIGDIVLIPFAGLKECILAKIISEPIYAVDTGLFTTTTKGEIEISEEGDMPFRPVGRKIEIINPSVVFADKRVLSRASLSRINPDILPC
jgi:hypothetical protein